MLSATDLVVPAMFDGALVGQTGTILFTLRAPEIFPRGTVDIVSRQYHAGVCELTACRRIATLQKRHSRR